MSNEDHIIACETCRGAGVRIIHGQFKDRVEVCPDCRGGERKQDNFNIMRGVEVPRDAKSFNRYRSKQSMKFPWRKMEVGDFWERDLRDGSERQAVVSSMKRFMMHHPDFNFVYKLSHNRATGERGIEVWRVEAEKSNEEEGEE